MIDKLTAVDINRAPLVIGDTVALSVGIIVGFRADENNRNNLYVLFNSRTIKTIDLNHPLNGVVDGEACLVSAYSARKLNSMLEITTAEDATTGTEVVDITPLVVTSTTPTITEGDPIMVSQPPVAPSI